MLVALGVPIGYVHGSLRISFGGTNTVDEVRRLLCPALLRLLRSHQL